MYSPLVTKHHQIFPKSLIPSKNTCLYKQFWSMHYCFIYFVQPNTYFLFLLKSDKKYLLISKISNNGVEITFTQGPCINYAIVLLLLEVRVMQGITIETYSKASSYTALSYMGLANSNWVQNNLRYTNICSGNPKLHGF